MSGRDSQKDFSGNESLAWIFDRAKSNRSEKLCLSASMIEIASTLHSSKLKVSVNTLDKLIGNDGSVQISDVFSAIKLGCKELNICVHQIYIDQLIYKYITIPQEYVQLICSSIEEIDSDHPQVIILTPKSQPDTTYHAESSVGYAKYKPDVVNKFNQDWFSRIIISFS